MKKIMFGAVALVAIGTAPALAADLPMKAAPLIVAPVAPSWTGCYVDGGVGYGMWNQDQYTETFPGLVPTGLAATTDGGRGWLGRFGAGCDYQLTGGLSNFVIGGFG